MPTTFSEMDSRTWWCRLTLRCLAASFAVVGAGFLFFPDTNVEFLNAVGGALGDFTPAPSSELRFWLSLTTGYMALVTALAYIAQRDMVRHRNLVALLVLGKAVTALTSLGFYLWSVDAFVYLLNFLVDGSITLMALVIWVAIPTLPAANRAFPLVSERPGAGAAALPDPVLNAVIEAVVPSGGSFEEGAADLPVARDVEEFVAGVGPSALGTFRLALRAFEYSPFFVPPIRFRRFSRLTLQERIRVLEAWETSRLMPRRQAIHTLKLLVMTQFYSRRPIEERLGYPYPLDRVPRTEASP